MTILELKNDSLNEVAVLVYADDSELEAGLFDTKGEPLAWDRRPHAKVFVEPGKKKPKPRADVSALRPGSLVLNDKAHAALGAFLSQFGQLLEIDVDGTTEWFYNVTNVIDCVDLDRSAKRPSGTIAREEFRESALPTAPALFKDPRTARTKIYVNESARDILERLIAAGQLTGICFADLGPAPPRPRPSA